MLAFALAAALAAPSPMEATAVGGVHDRALRKLLVDHWALTVETTPEWASALGDRRFDDRVSELGLDAVARRAVAVDDLLSRARALPRRRMSEPDAMYLDLFTAALEDEVALRVCRSETWALQPRSNILVDILSTLDEQTLAAPTDLPALLRRIEAWSAQVPRHVEALAKGLAEGRVASRSSVAGVLAMVERQLATPTAEWALVQRDVSGWGVQAATYAPAVSAVIDRAMRPALTGWRDFLRDRLLPAARPDDHPGLVTLPDGEACYAALVRRFTTLDHDAAALHQTGLDELARIHRDMRTLGARTFGVWDLPLIFDRLRTDPALFFADAAEIRATAETALRAAEAAVPTVFGRLPATPCKVSEVPAYEAPFTSIAYYRQPPADGSAPGQYVVNTSEPTTRPRYEAWALAFHEAVPGHHLQIALSYELPAAPAFHRFEGATVFVEGWALYAERLADELHLYPSDLERLGMLSFDTWRASRLVVDTGLHAKGWSRDDAIAFMLANTALAENNIRNEVDRYIAWPGQALAYKTGQLEILRLRREAEAALGDRFDLAGFHDAVLGVGAVSMPILRRRVEAWIAGR